MAAPGRAHTPCGSGGRWPPHALRLRALLEVDPAGPAMLSKGTAPQQHPSSAGGGSSEPHCATPDASAPPAAPLCASSAAAPPPCTGQQQRQQQAWEQQAWEQQEEAVVQAGGEEDGDESDSGATLRHRTLSFARCLARSPLLHSALLSIELNGRRTHGADGGPAHLEWTLAVMLALHLRTGDTKATGGSLLVILALLEAAQTAAEGQQPTGGARLAAWLEHLARFSPTLEAAMAENWPTSFAKLQRALSNTQDRLLTRVNWRALLDWEQEVCPCLRLLFEVEVLPGEQEEEEEQRRPRQPQSAASLCSPACSSSGHKCPIPNDTWCPGMHDLCTNIRRQASLVQQQQASAACHPATSPTAPAANAGAAEQAGRAAKRRRTRP